MVAATQAGPEWGDGKFNMADFQAVACTSWEGKQLAVIHAYTVCGPSPVPPSLPPTLSRPLVPSKSITEWG